MAPELTTISRRPSAPDGIDGAMASEYDASGQQRPGQMRAVMRVPLGQKPPAAIAFCLRARRADSSARVLAPQEFECCLDRERSLADRGTRRFSLLVLCRRAGERAMRRRGDVFEELAQQACKRLRSTDVVGRRDVECVQILLTDTEPDGAEVVALWMHQVAAKLGVSLEQTIYVYPCVVEPRIDDQDQDGDPRAGRGSNVPADGQLAGRRGAANADLGRARADRVPTNGKLLGGHSNGHAPHIKQAMAPGSPPTANGHWPVEDLWPLLCAPTPLWKRSLDILIAAAALVVLFVPFVLIAIAIRLDSAGPVIFRQPRAGRGGRPFTFFKFRSMIAGAEAQRAALAAHNEQDGPVFKMRQDPRITRVGRWLRRWSADELPQLWNVLKGDISLVGPRSPTLDEVCRYERWQRRRLHVSGGLTCTWQVSGRSQIAFRDWMRLDLRYVACRNVWLDLWLLAKTLPAVISGRGAS